MKGVSRRDSALLGGRLTYIGVDPCRVCGDKRRRAINGGCVTCAKPIPRSSDYTIRKRLERLFEGRPLIRQHVIALRALKKANKKPPRGG